MPRNKGGLWDAMKAGRLWHDPAKQEPVPETQKKEEPRPEPVKDKKTKKDKHCPNLEKRTNSLPKEDNSEKKVDIPYNHPDRKSQTGLASPGNRRLPKGKLLDLDLWEGDQTEIYPKITVMPQGLRFIGTHEEFMRLANKLLSS